MKALIVLFALLWTSSAYANLMSFDGLPGHSNSVWIEDGISASVSGGDLAYYAVPGQAHLDDLGTPFGSRVGFTMSSRFNANSFDLRPIAFEYFLDIDGNVNPIEYSNVSLFGLRGGLVVASDVFNMRGVDYLYNFSSAFSNLDELVVKILSPYMGPVDLGAGIFGNYFCNAPCSHFDIDNVSLSAVPLPPAFPLFVAALGILALIRKKMPLS